MNVNVYSAVAAMLDADASLTTQDKEKILAVCRHPNEFLKSEQRIVPQLLNTTAAAKAMGISRCTLWRMTTEGRLRAIRFRPDGSARYDLDDILALINEQKRGGDVCSGKGS